VIPSTAWRVSPVALSAAVLCIILGAGYPSPAVARTHEAPAASVQRWDPPKTLRKHPKIDSALLGVAEAALRGSAALAEAARGERVVQRGQKIRVHIESSGVDTAATRAAITAVRGDIDAEYAGVIRAFVAPGALERLAQHSAVRRIARPGIVIADGLVDEGVVASNASAWHSAGWDGRDVKIAIIDGGFIGYGNALLNGDLPMQTITQDFGCGGPELDVGVASPHGTAVARIVHQMAPAAHLYLLCVDDVVGLGQAKDYAISSGVKIINQSLGWFSSGRGDGSGGPATVDGIAASARTAGILWVNSAGNQAQQHWSGNFVSFDGDARHDFAVGDNLNDVVLTGGVEYCATLKWDAWPTTNLDYDLYLVRVSDNVVVDASENDQQAGTLPPVESVCFTSPTTTTYGLGIVKFSAATAPRFDLFSLEASPQYRTIPGSVVEPASSPNVMAVGAICWQNDALQSYSSQGPTIDGRIKPDIAGHDATSSDVHGAASGCSAGFRGTSASSPHVAGAAALALQANPTFTPTQLQSFLEVRAVELGTAGKDNLYGFGKMWLGTAPVPPAVGPGTYQDTSSSVSLSGTWTSWADGAHSGGSVKHANATGASASLTFTGSSVALVYVAQFNTGIATVSIDGTQIDQLDTYSAAQQLQRQKTYTMPAGTHTVSVAVSGNKNASSSGTYVVFDAFIVSAAPPAVGVGTYQDTSSSVNFSGSWTSWANTAHSGGSVKHSNVTGASASLTFTGSALTLVYVAQSNTGIATVSIDGTPVDQLDTYSAAQAFQRQRTYTMSAGTHTVSVAVSGNKNASSSATYVVFDAFIVSTAPPAVGVGTYQDTSNSVNFNGTWTSWANAAHSDGSVKHSNVTGASAGLTFTGSSLTLVYVAQSNTGIATVSIDGTPVDQLDTYSGAQAFQRQKTYSTTAGTHTVTVSVSGNKNASSSATYIVFDAFVVSNAPPAFGPGAYEDTSSALNFSGSWTNWANAAHSGGSVKHSNVPGASVSINVTGGGSVTLVYVAQSNTGIATVLIDTSTVDQLDTYSAPQNFQRQKTYAIPAGTHTVTVAVSGNKNASSSAAYVVFDAFIVSNAPPPAVPGGYEDTSSAVSFTGAWTSWADARHSGGSVKHSNVTGASVSLTFAGDAIRLTYVAQSNTGIATVMIDGTQVDQLDTYSAAQSFQQQHLYSTTNGTHTVTIVVSGNKNPASSATYIVFDNFVVSAPAPNVTMISEAGDYIGEGQLRHYTSANATFISNVPQAGTYISVHVNPTAGGGGWYLDFAAPLGEPLVTGTYLNAQRAAFRTGTAPGLDIGGQGRGCNTVSGSFTVYAVEFSEAGALLHFSATYEQHCEGGPAALRGAVKL
jgi:DNA-binding protein YbaB